MPHISITLNPTFADCRKQIEELARNGVPADAEEIFKKRNALYRMRIGDTPAIVKAFKIPGFVNSLVYTRLRRSKALRSYIFSQKMIELGFNAPEPIAAIEVRRGGRLRESYYICREIHACEIRHWEEHPEWPGLREALAAEMLRLHRAGVYHRDFSPGNVMIDRDDRGNYRFHYVDLNRMEFGVTDRQKLMSMFRSINLNRDELVALAEAYADVAGEDRQRVRAEALEAYNRYMRRRERKDRLKERLRK